jgi:hypothetical protein
MFLCLSCDRLGVVVLLSSVFVTLKFSDWCRRGDSNPHELPHTPLKRARLPVPPLRHRSEFSKDAAIIAGIVFKKSAPEHYWLAAGEAAGAAGEAASWAGAGVGVGVAAGALSDCNTDREPVRIGNPSVRAINMNAAAAPIVIFASRLAVPRGPKAVLERLLEKSAPASALPGCSRITTIKIKHAKINRP